MIERHDIHVVPEDGDGWLVRRGNERHPIGSFSTQDQAVREGRRVASEEEAELVVHGRDGQIRQKDSHGNDPRNILG